MFDTFMTDELHKARCQASRAMKETNVKLEKNHQQKNWKMKKLIIEKK